MLVLHIETFQRDKRLFLNCLSRENHKWLMMGGLRNHFPLLRNSSSSMVGRARHSLAVIVLINMFCCTFQRSPLFHVLTKALSQLMQKGSTRYKMVQTQEVNFAYIGQFCLIGLISPGQPVHHS